MDLIKSWRVKNGLRISILGLVAKLYPFCLLNPLIAKLLQWEPFPAKIFKVALHGSSFSNLSELEKPERHSKISYTILRLGVVKRFTVKSYLIRQIVLAIGQMV